MLATLDLHIHSERSPDGRMPLGEIIQEAKARGLQGIAICDHDLRLAEVPEPEGLLVIPGEEFSTEYGHLLGLFLYEPVEHGTFREIVAGIHAQGGLAVMAHPFERTRSEDRIAPVAQLLDGVETWNGRANRKNRQANAMAAAFAVRHGLPGFGGSDAHVPQEIGNGTVTVEVEALTPGAVREALLRQGNRVSGVNGKARYVAASQLTKRRKTHARPLSYAKWAAFAAKCWIDDLRMLGRN